MKVGPWKQRSEGAPGLGWQEEALGARHIWLFGSLAQESRNVCLHVGSRMRHRRLLPTCPVLSSTTSFAARSGREAHPAWQGCFRLSPQRAAPQSWCCFVQARRSCSIQPVTGIQAGTKFLPLFSPRLPLPEHISLPKAVCHLAHWQSPRQAGASCVSGAAALWSLCLSCWPPCM